MERNRPLERELLERAKAPDGFVDQVLARLDHVEATEGNTGWEKPVDELLAEMGEEAADIAGWAMGAASQLNEAQRGRLVIAVRMGVEAWREIEELREYLSDLRA
jgi:hypothetical protein